jgi:spore coat polysaccharide biosynthesis protein SpsF
MTGSPPRLGRERAGTGAQPVVFLVARTGSTRLPGKVLCPVAGVPLVVHQIRRMRRAGRPREVVVCTTTAPGDDRLVAVAEAEGCRVFRGSETDVPRRLLDAADQFDVDPLVVVEADEVFADEITVDAVFDRCLESAADFVTVSGYPIGSWVLGIGRAALRTVCSTAETARDGWSRLFTEERGFVCATVEAPAEISKGRDLRLTVDYPEDLTLVREVYERLYRVGADVRLIDVVTLCLSDPEVPAVNSHLSERYWARLPVDGAEH